MYFLAVIFPPLAVMLLGKPLAALLNIVLTFFGVIPGIIHAVVLVSNRKQEKRHKELREEIQGEPERRNDVVYMPPE